MNRRDTAARRRRLPVWRDYWLDRLSPHPDRSGAPRALYAPHRAFPDGTGHCHHYRMVNEHYHGTMEELEACPL